MAKVTAEYADKLTAKFNDNRDEAGWEEALWERLGWIDGLDTKQVDMLFGMIVLRWNRARDAKSAEDEAAIWAGIAELNARAKSFGELARAITSPALSHQEAQP